MTTESSAVPLSLKVHCQMIPQIGLQLRHKCQLWSDLHRNVGQKAIEIETLGKVIRGERF